MRLRPTWLRSSAASLVAVALGIIVLGVATDFCVACSALDARRLGFEVTVIEAGCRGIDVGGSLAAAWKQMEEAGVIRA